MDNSETYINDEIDLREVVLTLWRGLWVIIIFTLIAGVVAFAVSTWVLPEKYNAVAYVNIQEPLINFQDSDNTDININTTLPLQERSDFQVNTSLPDIISLEELVFSPSFLDEVISLPTIAPFWDDDKDSLSNMVEVSTVGKNMLRLQVSDTNPERSALLANEWADQAVILINTIYGVEAVAKIMKAPINQAFEDYVQAQIALENEISNSELSIFEAQLKRIQSDLSCVLSRSSAASRIIEDLFVLEQSLIRLPAEATLSLGDTLSLTTLQQRAFASQICASGTQNPQLQISSSDLLIGILVSEARETILQIQDALRSQQITLNDEQNRLEVSIPSLERNLEKAQHQIDQHTLTADQAQDLYTAILQEESRINLILMTNAKMASVSISANVPDKPFSPNVLVNTALAGASGLVLGVFWVFAAGWWRGNGQTVDADALEEE